MVSNYFNTNSLTPLIQAILGSIIIAIALRPNANPFKEAWSELRQKIRTTFGGDIVIELTSITSIYKVSDSDSERQKIFSKTITAVAIINAVYGFLVLFYAESQPPSNSNLIQYVLIALGIITILYVLLYIFIIIDRKRSLLKIIKSNWIEKDKKYSYITSSIFVSIVEVIIFFISIYLDNHSNIASLLPSKDTSVCCNAFLLLFLIFPLALMAIKYYIIRKEAEKEATKLCFMNNQCSKPYIIEARLESLFEGNQQKELSIIFYYKKAKEYLDNAELYIQEKLITQYKQVDSSNPEVQQHIINIDDQRKKSIEHIIDNSFLWYCQKKLLKRKIKTTVKFNTQYSPPPLLKKRKDELLEFCERLHNWGILTKTTKNPE